MPETRAPSAPDPSFGGKADAGPDRMAQVVQVAAGVIWCSGRFLAAKRPEGKPWPGFWEFPGGKRENEESMVETLTRELREELGITCVSSLPWRTVIQDYPGQRIALHLLHVTAFLGTPFARDGQELRWVTPEEARALPFLPADRELVAILTPPSGAEPSSTACGDREAP